MKDIKGREDWICSPVVKYRDAGPVEKANFDSILKILGGESETVEIHHIGWNEIILVHPKRVAEMEAISKKLEQCAVLDDAHLCAVEYNEFRKYWEAEGWKEFIRELKQGKKPEIIKALESIKSVDQLEKLDWFKFINRKLSWVYEWNGNELLVNFDEMILNAPF